MNGVFNEWASYGKVSYNCSVNLYADDTAIYSSSKDPLEVQEVLEAELGAVASRLNETG